AGAIAVRPALFPSPRLLLILVVADLTGAIGMHTFLSSRITCVDLTQSIDYLVPTSTGALLFFGPPLAILMASLRGSRRTARQRPVASRWRGCWACRRERPS